MWHVLQKRRQEKRAVCSHHFQKVQCVFRVSVACQINVCVKRGRKIKRKKMKGEAEEPRHLPRGVFYAAAGARSAMNVCKRVCMQPGLPPCRSLPVQNAHARW